MKALATIEGCDWVLHADGSVTVDAFCRVDTDGVGPHHGDRTAQGQTTYQPSLNADVDCYTVIPGKIRKMLPGAFIGCQSRVENLLNGKAHDAVCGDVGPDRRSGEVSYALAVALGVNPDPNKGGYDEARKFRHTFWPGKAAVVSGKKYKLQPA